MVGTGEQCLRHFETQRLGGPKIDGQFVLGRGLHWKISRLFTLKDAIDIGCHRTIRVDRIWTIGNEATVGNGNAIRIDGGEPVPRSEL
jgi:hypothetical protein